MIEIENIERLEQLARDAEQRAERCKREWDRAYQAGLRDAYAWAAKLLRGDK